jgi:hypothetical protein
MPNELARYEPVNGGYPEFRLDRVANNFPIKPCSNRYPWCSLSANIPNATFEAMACHYGPSITIEITHDDKIKLAPVIVETRAIAQHADELLYNDILGTT